MPVYKNQERNTWYTSFYYTDWQGNKKKKKKEGFKTQKEAKVYEREFLLKEKANCSMTFASLDELYMEDAKSRLKPTTYSNKEYVILTKILPFFAQMPINTITATSVRKWQNELISHKNNYSQTYLKTVNNQLSAIFNFAVKYYNLQTNPARICGSMGKKNAESMNFWTLEEFNSFIKCVENKPLSKAIFELLFWTGIRSGEMLALTLNDFDFEGQTVNIDKNYAKVKDTEHILDPKTPKSKRTITIPHFLCTIIKEYSNALYDYKSDERLFNVSKHYIKHEVTRGCKQSNVKQIRVHDIRHAYVKLLLKYFTTFFVIFALKGISRQKYTV